MAVNEPAKALLIFLNNRAILELLEDGDLGKLIKALMAYQETGVVPGFSGALELAFALLRRDVDQNLARWEAACARRSAAGKKGAAAKAAKNFEDEVSYKEDSLEESDFNSASESTPPEEVRAQTQAELPPDKQCQAKPSNASRNPAKPSNAARNPANQANTNTNSSTNSSTSTSTNTSTNSSTNTSTNTSTNSGSKRPGSPGAGDGGDFERFWRAYPRKVGKQAARRAFDGVPVPLDRLLSALERQRASPQWQRENGRYIPHPVTWLRQGRWEDEPPMPRFDCGAFGVECL